MKKEHINEIQGIIILALGLIILASLVSFVPEDLSWYTSQPNDPAKNLIRVVGAYTAGSLLFAFGYSSYFVIIFLFFWSWNKFSHRDIQFTFAKIIAAFSLFCVISSFFSMTGLPFASARFQRAGLVGYVCADFLVQYLGRTGAYIILFMLGGMTLILTGEFLVSPLFVRISELIHAFVVDFRARMENRPLAAAVSVPRLRPKIISSQKPVKEKAGLKNLFGKKTQVDGGDDEQIEKEREALRQKLVSKVAEKLKMPPAAEPSKPTIRIMEDKSKDDVVEDFTPKIIGEYRLPSLDLLSDPPLVPTSKIESDLASGAKTLEETLSSFGVSVRVADIERGPVITRYELEPAPGVKVQKITILADDIALAMKAQTVRIVAPIPGKNRVGIEVPNGSTAAVYLKDVLSQSQFQSSNSKLMLALGKDISGLPLIADLAEMPHLLIAGTTGSGKTVCVNSIIMSMLFNASPSEIKFLMVDPKMVELTIYNDIPHMLCPTVTDAKKVSAALNWVVGEMESRYSVLSKAGVRNIKAYNATKDKAEQLPYIIVVIDELADLMQVAAKTIESAITRLAQLSRAVGIHLILATQRPSVDVITGVIKANFPARISFKVASKVDSRTVLDMNGAENLIGKGDLLFIKPGDAKPSRGQCSYVNDEEVRRVIDFIKEQGEPVYNDKITSAQPGGGGGGSEQKDELYDEALNLVLETNQASVSILQRRMRLGYTRAARLIDMMEQNGIVGPYCGSKPRDILIDREEWLLKNMGQNQDADSQDEKTAG